MEYATKAVENGETIVGVKCKDGVILGAEKLIGSKLLVEDTNRRIYNIDDSIGMAITGKLPDGRNIMSRGRTEASSYLEYYDIHMPGAVLADRLGQYVHAHTLYGSYRPMGAAIIVASHDFDGFHLHMIEPSGLALGYHACAIGKGKQLARSELEKREFKTMTCKEALFYVIKLLHLSHEEAKEKKYEIELSWIHESTGFRHQSIPKDLKSEIEKRVLEEIERDQRGE